jgi:outer membrane immunogenic protein
MRNLKLVVPAAVAISAIVGIGAAFAADLATQPYTKARPMADPGYNWTGWYIGANAGISTGADPISQTAGNTAGNTTLFDVNNATFDPFGGIVGLQAGYNFQTGPWVWGVEGDIDYSGKKSAQSCLTFCDFNFAAPNNIQFDSVSRSLPWLATVRGRLGYARGPVLFYATGGIAFTDVKTNYSSTEFALPFSGSTTQSRVGWTVGGGIETALAGNWTVKAEYLYMDFGTATSSFLFNAGNALAQTSGSVHEQVARAGLNYRLGSPANAMASLDVAPMPSGPFNWTGFYVGTNAGYATGRNSDSEDHFGIFGGGNQRFNSDPRGGLFGGQAGYNWQMMKWVVGLEGDVQFANLSDTACYSWCTVGSNGGSNVSQKLDWFATARGRLGYIVGPTLLYATGGAAFTTVKTSVNVNPLSPAVNSAASFSNSRTGWTVGAGAETSLGGNWTAKIEYLYIDFGSFTDLLPGAPAFANLADPNVHYNTHARENIFRAGVNYSFNTPTVARY